MVFCAIETIRFVYHRCCVFRLRLSTFVRSGRWLCCPSCAKTSITNAATVSYSAYRPAAWPRPSASFPTRTRRERCDVSTLFVRPTRSGDSIWWWWFCSKEFRWKVRTARDWKSRRSAPAHNSVLIHITSTYLCENWISTWLTTFTVLVCSVFWRNLSQYLCILL